MSTKQDFANGSLFNFNESIQSMRPNGMSDADWQQIVNSNPYGTSVRNPTMWDNFLTNLGFTSKYDAYNAERLQNYQNYISQQVERWRQDKYNSPAHQAELLRQAGINPDISGNVNPVESAGDPNALSPLSDLSDVLEPDTNTLGNIVDVGIKTISTVASVMNGLLNLGKRGLELRNMDFETTRGVFGFAENFLNTLIPDETSVPEYEKMIKEGVDPKEAFSIIFDNTIDAAAKEANDGVSWFRSGRNMRLFKKSLNEYKQSSKYHKLKNIAFSEYKSAYVDKITDETELNSLLQSYNEYTSLVNEYFFPTIEADYKTYLEEAKTFVKQQEVNRQQLDLDSKIINKESNLLDKRYNLEENILDKDIKDTERTVENVAIEMSRLAAQKKIVEKVEAKLDDEDLNMVQLMFWNSILNQLNADLIAKATQYGAGFAKSLLGGATKFIPRPAKISRVIHSKQ